MKKNMLCVLLALAIALGSYSALAQEQTTHGWVLEEVALFENANVNFIDYVNMLKVRLSGESNYSLYDLQGKPIESRTYKSMYGMSCGLIEAENYIGDYGAIDALGNVVVPCEYDDIKYYSKKWQIGVKFTETDTEPYDYKSSRANYIVTQFDVYFKGELVKTLAREDFNLSSAYAYGDYLCLENRAREKFFYDSTFTPRSTDSSQEFKKQGADIIHVPTGQKAFCAECTLGKDEVSYPYRYIQSVNAIVDINGVEILKLDRVYRSISNFINGYAIVESLDTYKSGVIDSAGKLIIPCKYDYISTTNLFGAGYQLVRANNFAGFYNAEGELTCPVEFSYSSASDYDNSGMEFIDINNKHRYVSPALGMLEQEFSDIRLVDCANTPIILVANENGEAGVMDVYGNMILPYQAISMSNIEVSNNGKALIVKNNNNVRLYAIVEVGKDAPPSNDTPADEPPVDDKTGQPQDGAWTCECSSQNTSNFCPECGAPRPVEKVTVCPNCQTAAADAQNPPKFCPECGTRMNAG